MSFRSTLSHRSFRSLWLAQLTSRIGDSIHEIALIWLIYETTGDPTLLSASFVASYLPTVLLSLPAGALVDRINRKYVLVASDVVRGSVVLLIPLYGEGPLLVPLILVVAFVTGMMEAFFRPARIAIIPNLVPDDELDSANSLTEITFSVSQVLFALGGIVVTVAGSMAAFYVDSASFFLSALLLLRIETRRANPESTAAEKKRSVLDRSIADIKSGIRFVKRRPTLQSLIVLLAGLKLAVAPLNVAAPVFATTLPLSGSLAVGFIYTALFTGMALGSIFVSRFDAIVKTNRGRVITSCLAAFGVFLALAVNAPRFTSNVAVVLLLFGISGLLFATVRVPATTLVQILVPDEKRGRYMSIANTVTSFTFVLGLASAGPLIELIGASTLMVLVSGFSILLGVLFFTQPIGRVADETLSKAQS